MDKRMDDQLKDGVQMEGSIDRRMDEWIDGVINKSWMH